MQGETLRLRRLAVGVVGTAVLVTGLAGLLLPVLPGWLLIASGLALLGTEFSWARKLVERARRRVAPPVTRTPPADQDDLAA